MFTRELPGMTLGDVARELNVGAVRWEGDVSMLEADVRSETPTLKMGGGQEAPLSEDGEDKLAKFLGIPVKYYERMSPSLRQENVDYWLSHRSGEALISFVPGRGLVSIGDPSKPHVEPYALAEALKEVFPDSSTVVEFRNGDELMIDVLYGDENNENYRGGEVGDITRGGLRVGMPIKTPGKPWVNPYLFRLACTNGMEIQDCSLKITTRGNKPSDILTSFMKFAQSGLDTILGRIEEMYALKNVPVKNPELALSRIAEEKGIPDYLLRRMIAEGAVDGISNEFDLANLITNMALHPDLRERPNIRRRLERAGGSMVTDHGSRCPGCMRSV